MKARALILALAFPFLAGCASTYPSYPKAPSYWPQLEEWNQRQCVQDGGKWLPTLMRCERTSPSEGLRPPEGGRPER